MGDCVGILGLRQDQEDQDPHRSPHVVTLTSRHILSPLDTGPSRCLPEGPRLAAGAWRPSSASCGMRPSSTDAGTRVSLLRDHRSQCPLVHGRGDARTVSQRDASRPDASRRGAVCGSHVAQNALSVTSPPGRRGAQPPARLRGTMENGSTGQMRSGNPPPSCGGVAPGPAGLGLGPAAQKDAVWAEGLADGTPWARPGRHQAANGGLRRCRELRVDFACR